MYTDHKILAFENFNTQRVLRWRNYIEEFNPRLFYIEGKSNIMADAFSRLPQIEDPNSQAVELDCLVLDERGSCCRQNPAVAFSHLPCEPVEPTMDNSSDTFFGDKTMDNLMLNLPTLKEEVYDCFFNVPDVPMKENPLNISWIAESQKRDPKTRALRENPGKYYHLKTFGDDEVL